MLQHQTNQNIPKYLRPFVDEAEYQLLWYILQARHDEIVVRDPQTAFSNYYYGLWKKILVTLFF
jgi:hypothetical protein